MGQLPVASRHSAMHKIKIVSIIIIASVDLKGSHTEPVVCLYMTNSSSDYIISTTRILTYHIE